MHTVVHLFSFNNNSFWKLLSVDLFRRGIPVSPALNKRSATTDYGSTVFTSRSICIYAVYVSSDCIVIK